MVSSDSSATSGLDIETVRIPFIGGSTFRGTDASKDQRFVNAYFDVIEDSVTGRKRYYFTKRPGLSQNIRPSAGAATARGFKSWNGKIYSVYGTKIYANTTDLGVTLTTSSGLCGFDIIRPGAANQYLCINDGVKLFRISTADAVTTVTSNYPTTNTTDLIYFDGYLFVLKTDGTLWNCDLDDPATWNTTKFTTSMMAPATGVGLARQGDLIVVFGDRSSQAFFDNANSVGSPVLNYPQAMKSIGCASQNSIAYTEDISMWVGNGLSGGYTVWIMKSVGQPRELYHPPLNRILNAETTSLSSCNGKIVRTVGHTFYILKLTSSDRTFVYDIDLDIWTEWQSVSGGAFPAIAYGEHNKVLLAQHPTNGWIYNILPTVLQDDSSNFTVLGRFGRVDLDTTIKKSVESMSLLGDKQSSTTAVSFQYSDDDYITLSTARTFEMSDYNPLLKGGGSFKRRSFQISYAGANPLRLEGLQMRYRMGV